MGVEYFNCQYCKETTCDASDNKEFEIEDFGTLIVCPDCIKTMTNMLESSEAADLEIIIEDKVTHKQQIFKNIDYLYEVLEDHLNESQYKYGIKEINEIHWMESIDEIRNHVHDPKRFQNVNYWQPKLKFIEWQKEKIHCKKLRLAELEKDIENISNKRFKN